MLKNARQFLLNVVVFGWEDVDKSASPYFDERTLEEYVAAIVLAAYYLWPKENLLIIARKMNSLFPERLLGSRTSGKQLEDVLEEFVYDVQLIVSRDIDGFEQKFSSTMVDLIDARFYPPR